MSSYKAIEELQKEIKILNDEKDKLSLLAQESRKKLEDNNKKLANLQSVLDEEKKKDLIPELENEFNEVYNIFAPKINEHIRLAEKHLQSAIIISEREGIHFQSSIISLIELDKSASIDADFDHYIPNSMNKKWGQISSFLAKEYEIYDDGNGWAGAWMSSSMRC